MDDPSIGADPYIQVAFWLTWALVFILPMVHMVRSIDKGEFDKPRAVTGFVVVMFLAIAAQLCGFTSWIYAELAALVVFGVVSPWLGTRYDKKLHRQLDERYIQKCRDAVRRDADNAGAHGLLAEACAQNGWFSEAVRHYEIALTLSPDPDFNPQFDKWVRRLEAARRDAKRAGAKQMKKSRGPEYCPWWKLRV